MRVLCIDDDPHMLMLLEAALAESDIQARFCASGAEALAICADDPPDLVVTDLMMPRMDGHEVLRRLRADARTAQLPVVFMTGRASEDDVARYRAEGATAVIAKPIDLLTLADAFRAALR